ncbi:MAG: VTT domain-containing protein [Acidobacteriota bacterium]|nr:VTT domain-containing protein [Acidobacteriota bacterium]
MPRPNGRPLFRFALFVVILGAGFGALQLPGIREQMALENLAANLEQLSRHPATAPSMIVAAALLTAVGLPGTVAIVAAGAVFGTLVGGLVAWAGLVGGAALSYALSHTLARDLVVQLLGGRLGRFEAQLQRFGFWPMLRLRFLPMPFAVVNYSVCLAGVRFAVYMYSTAAALLPIAMVYAYFSASLIDAAHGERNGVARNLLLAIVFLFLLSFVPPRLSAWRQRRRTDGAPGPPPPPEGRS